MSVRELVQFLDDPRTAEIALENLLPHTQAGKGQAYVFRENDMAGVKALKRLAAKGTPTERNALSALVNLCDDNEIRHFLGQDLQRFLGRATSSGETHAGLLCMLLTNLVHDPDAVEQLELPELTNLALRLAADLSATFDYAAFVFAEVARAKPKVVSQLLPGLFPQLLLPSMTRRAGVAAAVKNALFDVSVHRELGTNSDLIQHVMIALKGPEDMDERDAAEIAQEVRSHFGPEKKREQEPAIQLTLVEILVLLSTSQEGRDALRANHAYYIVRELHLAASDPEIIEACERYVDQVMRGDPIDPQQADTNTANEDADDEVTEVV